MKYFTLGVVLVFALSTANLARADAIYDFSLPANGMVGAFDIELTFPDLLPADGLLVIPVTAPVVTSLTFGSGFNPFQSVIGLEITSTSTLFGLSMRGTLNAPILFTEEFPADFFVFNRTPLATGTFSSVSGNVVSVLPLATGSPVGTLSVTTEVASVPEPSTVLLLGSCLLCLAALRRLGQGRPES